MIIFNTGRFSTFEQRGKLAHFHMAGIEHVDRSFIENMVILAVVLIPKLSRVMKMLRKAIIIGDRCELIKGKCLPLTLIVFMGACLSITLVTS